jgi:hypothetical protein
MESLVLRVLDGTDDVGAPQGAQLRRHVMVMYEILSRKPTRFEVEVVLSFVRSPEVVEINPLQSWCTLLTHCWEEMLNRLDGNLTS